MSKLFLDNSDRRLENKLLLHLLCTQHQSIFYYRYYSSFDDCTLSICIIYALHSFNYS